MGNMCSPFTIAPVGRGSGRLTLKALHKRMVVKAEFQASVEMFVEVWGHLSPRVVRMALLCSYLTIVINPEGLCIIINLRTPLKGH